MQRHNTAASVQTCSWETTSADIIDESIGDAQCGCFKLAESGIHGITLDLTHLAMDLHHLRPKSYCVSTGKSAATAPRTTGEKL
jgi:hypothetical protein